jgi:hypothetical protein
MSTAAIEELRVVVADESVGMAARRDAAAHLTKLHLASIEEVSDTDEEVLELMKPWRRDTAAYALMADWGAEATKGRSMNGWSLIDAKAEVTKRRKLRALLSVVVNAGLSELEKVAAIDTLIADYLHPEGVHRKNRYTPERMLDAVKAPTATRHYHDMDGNAYLAPVQRPPMQFSDVWDF